MFAMTRLSAQQRQWKETMFSNGYCFVVWAAICPLENVSLIQIRVSVHKLDNEAPPAFKISFHAHDIALEICFLCQHLLPLSHSAKPREKRMFTGFGQNQLPHKGNAMFKAAGNHPLHSEQMNTEVDGKEMPV